MRSSICLGPPQGRHFREDPGDEVGRVTNPRSDQR